MFARIQSTIARMPGRTTIIFLAVLALMLMGFSSAEAKPARGASPCTKDFFCSLYEQDLPDGSDPQLIVNRVTHAYTGPGYDYLNFGDLPVSYTSQISGISKDGNWWVIPLPVEIAEDGMGWVASGDVDAKNALAIPEWLAHCDMMTYCGYVLSHSPQYVPVKLPSANAPKFGSTLQ